MAADHALCRTCTHRCAPASTNLVGAPDECAIETERCDVEAWQAEYFASDVKCPGYAEVVPVTGEKPATVAEIALSHDQEIACSAILDALAGEGARSLVLVGPAGTGKTTLVRELVRRIRATDGRAVAFAAPTGKAAVRLRESTGEPAATVHSLI
jgi:predicted AAA+ superfamily ATPase